ncbi:hypothetical protein IC582_003384 [Cucumis melo]
MSSLNDFLYPSHSFTFYQIIAGFRRSPFPLSVHSAVGPTPASLTLRLFTSVHSNVLPSGSPILVAKLCLILQETPERFP